MNHQGETVKNWISIVSVNPNKLKTAPIEMRDNEHVVAAAVCRPINEYFEFQAHGGLKRVFESLAAFKCASQRIRNNGEFVKKLLPKCSGFLFKYCGEKVLGDEQIFLMAAKYASPSYIKKITSRHLNKNSDDYEIAELLSSDIHQFTLSINAKSILPNNKDKVFCTYIKDFNIILKAIKSGCSGIYRDIDSSLKSDKILIIEALKKDSMLFAAIPKKQLKDLDVVMAYLKQEAAEQIYDSREFEIPLFWDIINPVLKGNSTLYIRMIKSIKTMNLKTFISQNAPTTVLNNKIIKDYLKAETKLSWR